LNKKLSNLRILLLTQEGKHGKLGEVLEQSDCYSMMSSSAGSTFDALPVQNNDGEEMMKSYNLIYSATSTP